MLKILILFCVLIINAFSMEQDETTRLLPEQYQRTLIEFKALFAEWSEVKGNSRPQAKAGWLSGVAFFNLVDKPEPVRTPNHTKRQEGDEPYLFDPSLKANQEAYKAEVITDRYDLAAVDIILNEPSLFNAGLNKDILTSIQTQARTKLQEWLVNESEDVRIIVQSILNRSTQGERSEP